MRRLPKALRYFVGLVAVSLICPLAGLAQQTPPREFPKTTVEGLVAEWERVKKGVKEYIDAMPEDAMGFKPTPEVRSFAGQYLHVANANFMFGARLSGAANPYQGKDLEKMDEYKGKAALTKVVMESYDFIINQVKAMDEAKLNGRVTVFNINMPRHVGLAKALEHQAHHRGQTTLYLRLKGITPPSEGLF
jgi:uncharacterized damage-inducible protein DinB